MRLDDIGFYTMTDARCASASDTSPLARCELVLTSRCNFRCAYCRHVGGNDLPKDRALEAIASWSLHGLQNLRLSGGEPTLWGGGSGDLADLVELAKRLGVKRVAIATTHTTERDHGSILRSTPEMSPLPEPEDHRGARDEAQDPQGAGGFCRP
jgi:organic radical activating enzyme